MPTYEYACPVGHHFDVIKRMADIDCPESCPQCELKAERQVTRPNLVGLGACTESAHFHPALGQVVKDSQHAAKIAKGKGMIEVGTEPPEKIHKHFEKQRKETREQRWADAERVKQFD